MSSKLTKRRESKVHSVWQCCWAEAYTGLVTVDKSERIQSRVTRLADIKPGASGKAVTSLAL